MKWIRILPVHAPEDYDRSSNGIAARFGAFLRAIREKKVRASKVSCELLRLSWTPGQVCPPWFSNAMALRSPSFESRRLGL